jgi:hypothetical protein
MCIRGGRMEENYVITFQEEVHTDHYHYNDDIFSVQQ